MTQDLLDPWSRAWSTGSIREAEFSHEGQELRHLQEPKWEVLSTEDSPEPLGCWGGDGAGWAGSICVLLSALDSSVVTIGGSSERFFLKKIILFYGKIRIT